MADRTPRATDASGILLGDLADGDRIGDYLIETRLATRGNGHLYRAVHVVLPRRVTIKVLPAAYEGARSLAHQLLREACIIEALDHPGIPRLYECGVLADRRPWIATELIEGRSVAAMAGAIDVFTITTIVRDVADILAHAHRRGVVHRNVSPVAIIVPAEPRRFSVCLVDWSGARTQDSTSPIAMVPPLGSHAYIAPEQIAGRATDVSGDVYALGMIARELLRSIQADCIPPVLASLVAQMVDFDPGARPRCERVWEAAAWLAAELQLEDDHVEPPLAVEEIATQPFAITPEIASAVSGAIDPSQRRR